jgi:hypothetical protein
LVSALASTLASTDCLGGIHGVARSWCMAAWASCRRQVSPSQYDRSLKPTLCHPLSLCLAGDDAVVEHSF